MLLVIVSYMFLYRTMKPAQQTQLRTNNNVAGMELNECEEHVLDTDDLETVQLVSADFNIPVEDKPSTDFEESGCREKGSERDTEEGGGQKQGRERIWVKKTADSEQVILLSDMEPESEVL